MSIDIPEINYYQVNSNTKVIFLHGGKNMFRVEILNRIGSRHENEDEYGLAHFFEHMVFKGYYKDKKITDAIDYYGCSMNASTSVDETIYWISGSSEHSEFMIDIILQMLFEPQFPECELKNEINVVLEELYMNQSSPDRHYYFEKVTKLYGEIDPIMTRPVIGYEENIKTFDREKLMSFYKNKYLTNEKIIIVLGNFDKQKIKKQIEKKLSPLTPWLLTFKALERELIINNYKNIVPGITYIDVPQDYCNICLSFRSINNYSCWVLTSIILSSILSSGSTSRLFKLLRDKHGLTYYQNAYDVRYDDFGSFEVSFGTRPENVQQALDIVINELFNFKDVNEEELEIVKNKYETGLLADAESTMTLGNIAIDYITMGKNPEFYCNMRNRIHKIKSKHINNFASKIFKKENMSVFISCKKEISDNLNIQL